MVVYMTTLSNLQQPYDNQPYDAMVTTHYLTIDIIDYVTGIGNYRPPTDNVCNDCAFKRKTCWLHVYDGPRSLYAQSNKVFYTSMDLGGCIQFVFQIQKGR